MTGDQLTLITPPVSYWAGRGTRLRDRGDDTASLPERDPAWDELVTWFEEHRDWCDLIQLLDEANR